MGLSKQERQLLEVLANGEIFINQETAIRYANSIGMTTSEFGQVANGLFNRGLLDREQVQNEEIRMAITQDGRVALAERSDRPNDFAGPQGKRQASWGLWSFAALIALVLIALLAWAMS